MNRRNSLKALASAVGGLAVLPAWANGWTAATLPARAGTFSATQQQALAAVADTIIPAGNSIGALAVGVDKFLIGLLENCYEKEVQDNVNRQLQSLDTHAQNAHRRPFDACSQAERQQLLLDMSKADDKEQVDFFMLMKSETIRGFNTSKEVMLGHLNYKIVPGHYYGCVDAKA